MESSNKSQEGIYSFLGPKVKIGQNPIEFYKQLSINGHMNFLMALGEEMGKKLAIQEWEKDFEGYKSTKIPIELIKLIDTKKKKDQVKCLKGLRINFNELVSFFFYAYLNHHFLFDFYQFDFSNKINPSGGSTVAFLDEETEDVKVFGSTNKSKGELKTMILQRKKTIVRVLRKNDEWHCFFMTFSSIRGVEKWKNGQCHFHYISDKFNFSYDEMIKQLSNKKYNLGSLPHIDLLDYGKQT